MMKFSYSVICHLWGSCLCLQRSPVLIVLLAAMLGANARANNSSEIIAIDPPALAFARYIASLNQRNRFTESGPVRVKIEAAIPGTGKQACLFAVREPGESERSEYHAVQTEGNPLVEREVIARYLSAQKQAEELPLSSTLITPANYKFRYSGSTQALGRPVYVFEIKPRKKRLGLIRGQIWIDPVTGILVHEAGHVVKAPSVLARGINITRDTTLRDGLPYARNTHAEIEARGRALPAELTITEQPVRTRDAQLQVMNQRGTR